ncbi:AraC family transcriptional regulator [Paraburkholderia caballeronis]|uniref:AraC family transcriptional regulator n=1 Tax=Paraburkholderia caballeronis TaxID=416943 RepID=UPI0011600509|nr:AraC family transcriptional regulator [Paraburkholderia caballeronis]
MGAWVRMRRLIERPDDIAVLAPLIGRKILSRPARRKGGTRHGRYRAMSGAARSARAGDAYASSSVEGVAAGGRGSDALPVAARLPVA